MNEDKDERKPLSTRLLQYTWPLIATPVLMVFCLGLIYPRLPATKPGWLTFFGTGGLLALWGCLAMIFNAWLQRQKHFRSLYTSIAALVMIAMGGGILWFCIEQQDFIAANFAYWHF
ncbi:hypothetical protein GCM10027046_38470 [Uliginosibacterium flavum]|uniref:Uncharacterized protein n=1 Tax=Uliginosibacterium flavum TaxID=1396831 RepID=A0ABV2TKW5_9RHOO